MKPISSLLLCFLSISSYGQFAQYKSSAYSRKFEVRQAQGGVFVEVFSGVQMNPYYVRIDSAQPELLSSLKAAQAQFEDWRRISRRRNVTSVSKPMEINFPKLTVYQYDIFKDHFYPIEPVSLKPIFRVSQGEPRFQLNAGSRVLANESYTIMLSKKKEFIRLLKVIS